MAMPKMSPLASLMGSMGIDIPDMMKKFELLQQYVIAVDKRLEEIQKSQKEIIDFLKQHVEEVNDGSSNNGDARTH